ncbi:glycosyltransferase family 4 protein [Ascidiimonas sp. W6]|uniref:glycosyltransferase family 4 protein n=1 Tax=Ascidiimonas meishanensis TaxID=3128903 RepID=UPI0030EBCB46
MKNKTILLLASFAKSLVHFRGDFIKDLIIAGYDVVAASPDIDDEIKEELIQLGAKPVEFELQRAGLNPLKDLKTIAELKKLMKREKIDIVFPYTIKPVVYGSIAARALNLPVFSLITGLGYTFSGMSKKARTLQKVTQTMYRYALKSNNMVIFQNKDDYQLFLHKKILSPNFPVAIVNGSGVNLDKYPGRIKENDGTKMVFVFVARLIREKGIHLLIEAAEKLKPIYPHAEFHILGDVSVASPSAIHKDTLKDYHDKGIVVHHGKQNNIEDYLTASDVFVLPTFYREGVPRSSLEALSIGMPIIITNTAGCKETVTSGENGILIEPRSLEALVAALEFFLKNPVKVKEMGIKSRKLAETKFDVKLINEQLISLIEHNL